MPTSHHLTRITTVEDHIRMTTDGDTSKITKPIIPIDHRMIMDLARERRCCGEKCAGIPQ
jgi:hypothetical protein